MIIDRQSLKELTYKHPNNQSLSDKEKQDINEILTKAAESGEFSCEITCRIERLDHIQAYLHEMVLTYTCEVIPNNGNNVIQCRVYVSWS